MITKIIEAGQSTDGPNWGKFLVGRFDAAEWQRRPSISNSESSAPLLHQIGWGLKHVLVLDLQTGEGAIFGPGGSATADLNKHRVWVCPMFEPFLEWLYKQDLQDLAKLPDFVALPNAQFDMQGYRRTGKKNG